MKKYVLCFLLFSTVFTLPAQLTTQFIEPNVIDTAYSTSDDSNYVAIDPSVASLHRLLVFLPGTGAKTKHYQLFPNLAAELGYHCISLSYPNGYPTVAMSCAGNPDTNCYWGIRQEVCYGTDVSSHETVDTLNSIYTRLVKTLQYLDAIYPSQNWGQFLNAGAPVWNKIAVSGHSQGGGHALYLAKTQGCERIIMFAGADDYSNYYSAAANWVSTPGLTPLNKHFSFLHLNDDVWDYSKQYTVVQASGMTSNGDDSTTVDNASPPYSGSHCLYTAVPPLFPGIYSAEHNGPVVDFYTPLASSNQPLYLPVWTYMLIENPVGLKDQEKEVAVRVFPNPAAGRVYIQLNGATENTKLTILNALGAEVFSGSGSSSFYVDTEAFATGVYFVIVKTNKDQLFHTRLLISR